MQTISEVLQEVVDALTSAGLPTSVDPAELDLPGAWITPARMDFNYLSGEQFDFDIEIYLLAPNNGALENISALQEMGQKVRSVYNVASAEFVAYPIGPNKEPFPCLIITLSATITKD